MITSPPPKWQEPLLPYKKQSFLDLFYNIISHIRVDHFLTKEQCHQLSTVSKKMNLGQIAYDDEFGKHLENPYYLYEHYVYEQAPIGDYLPKAKQSIHTYQVLCELSRVDPALILTTFLAQFFGKKVSIAKQNGEPYNFVIIRDLSASALLHADYAGFSPKYWTVSNVIAQYGWNIYLTDPGQGGELIVYNKPWDMNDEKYYLEDTYYGYQKEVVDQAESISIFPRVGQLVFFNSRNFHEIKASSQSRMTIGGHIGLSTEEEILLWV